MHLFTWSIGKLFWERSKTGRKEVIAENLKVVDHETAVGRSLMWRVDLWCTTPLVKVETSGAPPTSV